MTKVFCNSIVVMDEGHNLKVSEEDEGTTTALVLAIQKSSTFRIE
jgi:hypothetical protein